MRFKAILITLFVALLLSSAVPALATHANTPTGANAIMQVLSWRDAGPRVVFENDWAGIGGPDPSPDDNDPSTGGNCANVGGDEDGTSTWDNHPPIVPKLALVREEITGEESVASDDVTELCKSVRERLVGIGECPDLTKIGDPDDCHTYANEPQRVGIGATGVRVDQAFYPIMDFDSAWASTGNPTVMSCRIDADTADFDTTRNRGLVGQEPNIPSEVVTGTLLTGSCIDQSEFLEGQYNAGQINTNGGTLDNWVPITGADPDFDMGVGLWAVCISTTLRDSLGNVFLPDISDYSWFWVDSAANNFGLAEQWAVSLHWDGDSYTAASHPNDCRNVNGLGGGGFPL